MGKRGGEGGEYSLVVLCGMGYYRPTWLNEII